MLQIPRFRRRSKDKLSLYYCQLLHYYCSTTASYCFTPALLLLDKYLIQTPRFLRRGKDKPSLHLPVSISHPLPPSPLTHSLTHSLLTPPPPSTQANGFFTGDFFVAKQMHNLLKSAPRKHLFSSETMLAAQWHLAAFDGEGGVAGVVDRVN